MAIILDTKDWKEYKVGDLFTVDRGAEAAPKQNEDGWCPLINETEDNNGFTRLAEPTEVFAGNAITISINFAKNVFYQPEDFCASVNIAILRNPKLNVYNGLFIAQVFRNENVKYDYGYKISNDRLKETILKLPADSVGNPDWQFMEDYIKSLHHKPLTTKNKQGSAPKINTLDWKEFSVGELFTIRRGERIVHNEDYFDTQDNEYRFPVITTTTENNGVDGFYNRFNTQGNCIVSGGEASGMFTTYQEQPFWGLDTVRIYEPIGFKMNKYIALFLATELTYNMYRFSYGRKAKPDNMYTLDIKLPIDTDGNPDWQFMEDYIKALPYGDRI